VAGGLAIGLVAVVLVLAFGLADGDATKHTNSPAVPPVRNSTEQLAAAAGATGSPDEPDAKEATVVRAGEESDAPPAPEGKPLLVLDAVGHTTVVKRVFFTPDASQVITVSGDKTVRVWDVADGEPYRTFRLPIGPGTEGALYSAALSADGKRLAVSGMPIGRGALGMLIYILGLDSGKVETVLKGHSEPVVGLAWSPDGRRLASASLDNTARIYDVRSGQTEHTLQCHRGSVKAIAYSPDGRHVA